MKNIFKKIGKFFEEHDLLKILFIMLFLILVLSWLIPATSFNTDGSLVDGTIQGLGLSHIFYAFIFSIQNYSIQIAFLLFVGMFYGVVSQTEMYRSLVLKIARFAKGKEIPFTILVSLLITVFASVLNNTMVLLVFVPFIFTILRKMGFNKVTSFATTFGSILVGVLGATIGTDTLTNFVKYIAYAGAEVSITTELVVRIGILVLAFILFQFFNIISIKKQLGHSLHEENDDVFKVEEPKKKARTWPIILGFIVLFVFAILGFVSWEGAFGLEIFKDFHSSLIGDVPLIQSILGAPLENLTYELVPAFGTWYLFTYLIVLAFVLVFIAFASRMKLNDFFTNAWEGVKKTIRPVLFLVLAYMVFVFIYWSPMIPAITNFLNISALPLPFRGILQAIAGSFFNSDFAFLGFSINYYLATFSGTELNIMFLIYTTIYGLVQFFTPVSVFLIFGLAYSKLLYKDWLKYIWKFLLCMFVCLVAIFALLFYL